MTKLEILGKTCLLLANKVEEIFPFALKEISTGFSVEVFIEMERDILNALRFKLTPNTLYFWFDLAVKLCDVFVTEELH